MKDKRYSNDPSFARVPNHKDNPDYRMIIIYSFYEYYLSYHSKDKTSNELSRMVSDFRSRKSFILKDDSKHYLEMYAIPMSGKIGYSIVEKNDAIDSLTVYPYSTSDFNGKPNKPRMLALSKAINDVERTKGKVIDLFKESLEWRDLEPKLKAVFRYRN